LKVEPGSGGRGGGGGGDGALGRETCTDLLVEGSSWESHDAINKTIKSVEIFLMAPNNQDKGPTRQMITRLNLMFPRRSP